MPDVPPCGPLPGRVPPDRRPFAARQTRRMIGSVEVRRPVVAVWCVEVGLRSAGGGHAVPRVPDRFPGTRRGGHAVLRVSDGFRRTRKKAPRLAARGCGDDSLLITGSLPVVSDGVVVSASTPSLHPSVPGLTGPPPVSGETSITPARERPRPAPCRYCATMDGWSYRYSSAPMRPVVGFGLPFLSDATRPVSLTSMVSLTGTPSLTPAASASVAETHATL